MGQRLKVLTILAGDLGSVSSTYMVVPKKPVTTDPMSSGTHGHLHTHTVHMNSKRCAHIHTCNRLFWR